MCPVHFCHSTQLKSTLLAAFVCSSCPGLGSNGKILSEQKRSTNWGDFRIYILPFVSSPFTKWFTINQILSIYIVTLYHFTKPENSAKGDPYIHITLGSARILRAKNGCVQVTSIRNSLLVMLVENSSHLQQQLLMFRCFLMLFASFQSGVNRYFYIFLCWMHLIS